MGTGKLKAAPDNVRKAAFASMHEAAPKMVNPAMSNMPPQPSNVMGMATPVFDPRSMAAANNIYGDQQMRQNAVNAPNVFATPLMQKDRPERKKERRTRKDGSVIDTDGSVYPAGFFDKTPPPKKPNPPKESKGAGTGSALTNKTEKKTVDPRIQKSLDKGAKNYNPRNYLGHKQKNK